MKTLEKNKLAENQINQLTVDQIINENKGLLYYIIRPIVGDENLVEDCFATVCRIITENYHKFDAEKGSLTAWLTKVARNGAINFVKSGKNAIISGSGDEELLNVADFNTPEDIFIRKENLEELKRAVTMLKSQEINILLRKYYYLQTAEQIGAELGLSLRAVEGKLHRIRKKIAKEMGGKP